MRNFNYSDDSVISVQSVLSRTSFVTLTVSTAAFSLFVLLGSLASAFSFQKISVLESLYYLFGNDSVMAVNLVVGLLVFAAFAIMTAAMAITHSGSKGDSSKLVKGLNLMLGSLIYMVILASCLVIVSLSSISVTYYQSVIGNKLKDSHYYTDYSNSSFNFFVYVLFGAGAITLIIALIRLVLSMRRAALGQTLTAKGAGLALISSIACASLTGISFIVNLCRLVMPDSYIVTNTDTAPDIVFNPSVLMLLMLNVIISAAMVVILTDIPVITSLYSSEVHRMNRSLSNNMYSNYATNVYNQTPNRTPYTNPVQPQPYVPYGQPYEQFHAQKQAEQAAKNNSDNTKSQQKAPVQQNTPENTQTVPSDNGTQADDNGLNLNK
ncbi:MAG: hypothetical protein PUG48_03665 [Clostridia bacterium]|nr:hypothetical protein [Clostridia bacterium]